ncbi:MAG: phage baseplate assembly protein V [Varibaculum sp.]
MPVAAVSDRRHVHRLAAVADPARRSFAPWWAPSVGEQVLILSVGGELDTAFVHRGFIRR